jgi:cysteine-rich repeat protein
VEWGEECDDGNTQPGDGCDASCQVEGGLCVQADTIDCGDVLSGDTSASGTRAVIDLYACNSSWDESGPERAYLFTATQPGGVHIEVFPDGQNLDLDLFVLELDAGGDCDPGLCLESGDTEIWLPQVQPGQSFWIVVDGYQGASGAFDLELSCMTGGTP